MSISKGKFRGIARKIAGILIEKNIDLLEISDISRSENNRKDTLITSQDISRIISINLDDINFYPSDIKGECRPFAIFLCLQGKLCLKKRYKFANMLEDFSRHMHGGCRGKTKEAVIITNTWWPENYEKYYDMIQNAKLDGLYLEVYYIGPAGVNSRPDDLILELDI